MNRSLIFALVSLTVGCNSPMDLGGRIRPASVATGGACTQDADCVSGDHCANQTCVADGTDGGTGGDGTTCTANNQCTSGVCGVTGSGHCCAVTCAQDSAHSCAPNDCDDLGACTYPCNANCAKDADCKDTRICEHGACVYPAGTGNGDGGGIGSGQCFIGGEFLTAGTWNSNNSCQACEPARNDLGWTTTFQEGATFEIPTPTNDPYGGSLDGPWPWASVAGAKPDSLLFSEPNSNGVAFLNLDGGLSEGTSVSVGLARIPFLVSIDLNGDGLNDIVAVGWLPSTTGLPQDGVIAPFLTDDAGGFSQGPTSSIATAAIQASLDAVATGDFDGNGKLGLLVLVAPDVSPGPANELVLYPQDGDGGFAAPTSIASLRAPGPGFYQPMAVGDINGDGKADVVVLDTPGSFTVLLSGGSGQFTTSTFDVPGASPGYGSLVVGDFDGDGHLDLAFSNPDVTVSVVLGDGQGNFGPAKISEGAMLSGTTYPSMLVADDLNGDGHPDVAVLAPVSPPFLRLLIGKGDGTFEPPADFMFSDPSMNLNPLISIPQPSDPGSGRADLSLSYVRYVAGKSAAGGFMLLENGCN